MTVSEEIRWGEITTALEFVVERGNITQVANPGVEGKKGPWDLCLPFKPSVATPLSSELCGAECRGFWGIGWPFLLSKMRK